MRLRDHFLSISAIVSPFAEHITVLLTALPDTQFIGELLDKIRKNLRFIS
jgi:hypothetical protein